MINRVCNLGNRPVDGVRLTGAVSHIERVINKLKILDSIHVAL